ncbi:hypothetical protein J2W17_000438 [Pseudomonas lini]|nr:hypothetical protein [Pseudomonas lini]
MDNDIQIRFDSGPSRCAISVGSLKNYDYHISIELCL